ATALLRQLDLRGLVVTGDAQFCQAGLSRLVVRRGGHYLWAVKGNQPDLLEDLRCLFAWPAPGERFAEARTGGRHGDRHEHRALRASPALNAYLRWPHVGQVCAIARTVTRRGRPTP